MPAGIALVLIPLGQSPKDFIVFRPEFLLQLFPYLRRSHALFGSLRTTPFLQQAGAPTLLLWSAFSSFYLSVLFSFSPSCSFTFVSPFGFWFGYSRPKSAKMITITKSSPTMPPGAYPQDVL
jgi:hypothetical protein